MPLIPYTVIRSYVELERSGITEKKVGYGCFLLRMIRLLYNPCVMNCLPVCVLFGVLYFAVSSWLFENKLEL
ncbi:hypothetical protein [Treponema lecithinolyticum]